MTVDEKNELDRQLLLAFAPLHRSALGEACGIVCGVELAVATLVLVLRGGHPEPNLGLLSQFFWGYSISWRGVFIGLFWGWATGFTVGWGFALVRNAVVWAWLMVIRSRAEMDQYSDFLDHL
jgi:hypothetical protein